MSTAACYVAGAFEHPGRKLPDVSAAQIASEVTAGALADAGLGPADVDALFCDATLGPGAMALATHLGFANLRYVDTTDTGGSSYLIHVGHALSAMAMGRCDVAVVVMAGHGRSGPPAPSGAARDPAAPFEAAFGMIQPSSYALLARRHMYEYGTTSRQLAEVRVAAAHHAQYNEHALFRKPVTVDEVLDSPMVSDPLHRLDCCVTTDGGGALVLVSDRVRAGVGRPTVPVLGYGHAIGHNGSGRLDLSCPAAVRSGRDAFAQAGLEASDIDYASIYDSFTITVIQTLEALGFCDEGAGGRFVMDGGLIAPDGALPINTDGGGLCNNHPGRRGGMIRMIEAVRQARGEAHPQVQVPSCDAVFVHGTGGSLASRYASASVILGAAR